MKKSTIKWLLNHPTRIIPTILIRFGKHLPDRVFLKLCYYNRFGRKLNLNHPQTFNEKLQWLKLHDRNPEHTTMVDKIEVKKWVADRIGERFIIPTLGVWERAEDIDFDSLPDQFVLKTNHDSGKVVICKDKSTLDISNTRKILSESLHQDYYILGREWPYKDVKRRIFAEKYVVTPNDELSDYKFFCFDGVPKFLFIATERNKKDTDVKFDFFDIDFNHLPVKNGHENADNVPEKPDKFDEMVKISSELSRGCKHVRVDLYNINGEIYFGELTFFHHAGFMPFIPDEWDYEFGKFLTLK